MLFRISCIAFDSLSRALEADECLVIYIEEPNYVRRPAFSEDVVDWDCTPGMRLLQLLPRGFVLGSASDLQRLRHTK